jgi:hypothetical protein
VAHLDDTEFDEFDLKHRLWTTQAVDARLRATFHPRDVPDAAVLLAALVGEIPDADTEASDLGTLRLMLDAIKVSDGDLRKLALWIEVAHRDPRDLVAAAEYRRELSEPTQKAREADLAEYLLWLSDPDTPLH